VSLFAIGPTAYQSGLRRMSWFEALRWTLVHPHVDDGPCPLTRPLGHADWDGLLACVGAQRVAGHLASAIDAGLPVTATQRDQAQAAHRTAVMADLSVEQAAHGLAGLLEEHGFRWRLSKGLVAARVLYPDPALRSTGDVDVLVHPADFDAAVEAIQTNGGAAWEHLRHGAAATRAAAARTFMHASGIELDVHREVRGHSGRYTLPTDVILARPQQVEVWGRAILAPSTPALVLHAMLHLSKGGPGSFGRLSTLGDLLWARRRRPSDYRRALELSDQVGCTTPARWANRVVDSWLPSSTTEHSVGADGWRLWAFDRTVGSQFVAAHLHRFVGPSRLRRAWEAAVPARDFRQSHERTFGAQMRHIAARILTGRSPR
jgi:hypothetical protein